jgi:hypothetical protein
MFKVGSKARIFLDIANVDEDGFSDMVPREIFEKCGLNTTNGGDWCRTDGPLGKKYNVYREHANGKPNGKIIGVQLQGHIKNTFERKTHKIIKTLFKKSPCVVLAITSGYMEIDHKDGRYDAYGKLSTDVADYQPLHKCVNDAKRTHCRKCKETGIRFDARILGFSVSQYKGRSEYSGSCIGCYWYDPIEFNKNVSVSYKSTR